MAPWLRHLAVVELAERLGYHPGALTSAACRIKSDALPLSDYIGALDGARPWPENPDSEIGTILESEFTDSDDALQFLHLGALLHYQNVRLDLFAAPVDQAGPGWVQQFSQWQRFKDCVDKLERHGLARMLPGNSSFSMEIPLQHYLLATNNSINEYLRIAICMLGPKRPRSDAENFSQLQEKLRPHFAALAPRLDSVTEIREPSLWFDHLILQASFHRSDENFEEANRLYTRAYRLWKKGMTLISDDKACDFLFNFGLAARGATKYPLALLLCNEVHALADKEHNIAQTTTLNVAILQASIYNDLERPDRALELLTDIRADDSADFWSTLGTTYSIQNEKKLAVDSLEKAYDISLKTYGKDSRSALASARDLANACLRRTGFQNWDRAKALLESVIEVLEAQPTKRGIQLMETKLKLAATLVKLRESEHALSLYEEILEWKDKNLTEDDPRGLRWQQQYGCDMFDYYCYDPNRNKEFLGIAKEQLEIVYNKMRKGPSPDDYSLGAIQVSTSLAMAFAEAGETDRALHLFRAAECWYAKQSPTHDRLRYKNMFHHAEALWRTGKPSAIELYNQVAIRAKEGDFWKRQAVLKLQGIGGHENAAGEASSRKPADSPRYGYQGTQDA
jgi:hypothetical protein